MEMQFANAKKTSFFDYLNNGKKYEKN